MLPISSTVTGSAPKVQLLSNGRYTVMMNAVGSGRTGSEGGERNYSLQKEMFKTAEIPLYAIIKPTGEGRYEVIDVRRPGLIRDVEEFVAFLAGPRS